MVSAHSNREMVLSAIRSALYGSRGTPLPDSPAPISPPLPTQTLVSQFTKNAAAVGVQVSVATDSLTASRLVRQWLDEESAAECFYVPTPLTEKLGLSRTGVPQLNPFSPQQGNRDAARTLLFNATAGLNEANAGIGNTGTLVEISGGGRSRLASLLPPVHISILLAERIYADLRAWLHSLNIAAGDRLPSNFALITGPSRSADIEQSLSVGVHGPRKVYVLIADLRG